MICKFPWFAAFPCCVGRGGAEGREKEGNKEEKREGRAMRGRALSP